MTAELERKAQQSLLVVVKPLEKKKWHGKDGKENFSRPMVIEALYDEVTGKYATGLNKEEAFKYGELLGVDLSDKFDFNAPHPYFSTKPAAIPLPNHTLTFDTSKPVEYVKVKVLKASKYVANSMKEYDEGLWPFATHVIFDEQEEVSVKATRIENKRKANLLLGKMSPEGQIAMVQVIKNKNLKKMSPDFLTVEMDDIIENHTLDFLKYSEMGKEEVTLRATMLELIDRGVLTKDGTNILYMGEKLGYDFESALDWFKNPENQIQKVYIFDKLNK